MTERNEESNADGKRDAVNAAYGEERHNAHRCTKIQLQRERKREEGIRWAREGRGRAAEEGAVRYLPHNDFWIFSYPLTPMAIYVLMWFCLQLIPIMMMMMVMQQE
jgi:hypothetical protein